METNDKKILVIDDEAFIRESVTSFLEDFGYDVIEAENGRKGLELFEKEMPDLVLCDLRMPEMDGLEVLGNVTETYPEIPIIIVSGAGNIKDTVEALKLGAWDYIIKPVQDLNVLSHAVEKALERAFLLKEKQQHQDDLEKANAELKASFERLEQTRDQLVQSEKMAALGGLVAGVAHEINTPVGVGVTAASFLQTKTNELQQLYESGDLKRSELETYLTTIDEVAHSILINMERAAGLISSFKQVAVDQSNEEKRLFNIHQYIGEVLLSLRPKYKNTGHDIEVICPDDFEIYSYPGAFSQIISNLLVNSLTHGLKDVEHGKIVFEISRKNGDIWLVYRDNGAGMTEEQKAKMFEPFYTTMRGKGGTGLGMSIVFNLVTQTLKGTIECRTAPGSGAEFTIKFPQSMLV
ncbi:MAG TPA: response regulator [Desulfobacteraceae bacterium]|nr:response regulator [Desulfobacteraceae bacterium]